jgi:hypothetical protein
MDDIMGSCSFHQWHRIITANWSALLPPGQNIAVPALLIGIRMANGSKMLALTHIRPVLDDPWPTPEDAAPYVSGPGRSHCLLRAGSNR